MSYRKYKAVHILGLYRANVQTDNIDSREQLQGDVWSLTDWYRSYPWLTQLDRHYELHGAVATEKSVGKPGRDQDRFPGDWKQKYRDHGGKIVVWDMEWLDVLGLPKERFETIDAGYLTKKYGREAMSSTVSIMILDAIEHKYERIWLHGLCMIGSRHEYFIPGVLEAMDAARREGIKITANFEHEWRAKCTGELSKIGSYIDICKRKAS